MIIFKSKIKADGRHGRWERFNEAFFYFIDVPNSYSRSASSGIVSIAEIKTYRLFFSVRRFGRHDSYAGTTVVQRGVIFHFLFVQHISTLGYSRKLHVRTDDDNRITWRI